MGLCGRKLNEEKKTLLPDLYFLSFQPSIYPMFSHASQVVLDGKCVKGHRVYIGITFQSHP